MFIGVAPPKKPKKDTVHHMINCFTEGEELLRTQIGTRFKDFSIVKEVYITRHLTKNGCQDLQVLFSNSLLTCSTTKFLYITDSTCGTMSGLRTLKLMHPD
jgi:hypothetical protein